MKRSLRRTAILAGIGVAAVGSWVLVPSPFVHGVIAGFVGGLGLLVGAFGLFARRMRGRMQRHLAPPPLPTASWDYASEFEDLEGNRISAGEFRGSVLVLNFWATWCAPCIAEMPSLVRLHEAVSDLGVKMACVTREPREVVVPFLEKRRLDAPVYLLLDDPPEPFKTRGIPATFVLDRNGMVALRHVGAASWDDESVINFVRGLAATPQA